jgi:hypothetical protein
MCGEDGLRLGPDRVEETAVMSSGTAGESGCGGDHGGCDDVARPAQR